MDKIITKLRKREDYEISTRPLMFLECFRGLRDKNDMPIDDYRYCMNCKIYQQCKPYLDTFQIKEVLFKR